MVYTAGEYWVTFDVLETEARQLEDATGADDRVGGVITQEPSDGTATVVFQVVALDDEGAWREAEEAYETIRQGAQLDNAPALGGTVTRLRDTPVAPPAPPRQPTTPVAAAPQPYETLLERAHTLLDQKEFEHATIAAQSACEVAIGDSMRRLIFARAPSLQRALEAFIGKQFALSNGRMTDLWRALAGDDIRKADFWMRYRGHVARRNGAIHEGSSVTRAQAEDSMQVAREVCDYVTQMAP
jgi:hypothetical protein